MVEYTEWLRLFILHYPSISYFIVFLGVIFTGGVALFVVGFMAAQKVISIFSFTLIGFLAVLFSDSLWFLLARTAIVEKIILHRYANKTTSIITRTIVRLSRGSHSRVFILAKILIGTPFILIIYLKETRLTFRDFFYYNILSIILWLLINISIGFISGLGFTYLANLFNNLYTALGFLLLLVVVIAMARLWLKERFYNTTQNM
jgi:membrane protein DedA with SNARE-associated domain